MNETHMNDMAKFGMNKCGEWNFGDSKPTFDIYPEFSELNNVTYAFVFNGVVTYVGQTEKGMKGGCDVFKSVTDEKDSYYDIKIAITEALERGKKVEIFCVKPIAKFTMTDEETTIDINVRHSIKEYLIDLLQPELNKVKIRICSKSK